ncbi:MAG: hypoxanthine phosphoribosyltransferase [Acidobacteria bacterium]|nr:hypoxanthine phosphoribosyltransferase [Acidobacteriota bacterium]
MKIAFSEEQIQNRVQEMAGQISKDYSGEPLHAVGILDTAFMFMADLVRRLTCPTICEFIRMETVDTAEVGHQTRRNILYGPMGGVEGKNILLVEAMVDSGITLDHLAQQLLLKRPKTLRIAVLVNREDRRKVPVELNYTGFTWEGDRLVGYGLDKNGLYRNLPYLAVIHSSEGTDQEATIGEARISQTGGKEKA